MFPVNLVGDLQEIQHIFRLNLSRSTHRGNFECGRRCGHHKEVIALLWELQSSRLLIGGRWGHKKGLQLRGGRTDLPL